MRSIRILFPLLLILSSASCKKNTGGEEVHFEKKQLMENIADAWIYPAYQYFSQQMDSLNGSWNAFLSSSNQTELATVQNAWKKTYLAFQQVKFIDFGPAMDNGFVNALGTFPSDTSKIESNITIGSYNLETVENISAIGLPALDYLLFAPNSLINFQNQTNRKVYVTDLLNKMINETNYVVSNWNNYRSTFVAGTGTSSTSPFSLLTNAFVKDFELAKNAKIGIPFGKQSLGIQRLEYLETRYSGFGRELLIESLKTIKAIFMGSSYNGTTGVGFDDYLIALEKQSLATTIETRLDNLVSTATVWNFDLEEMMVSSTQEVDDYYTYMQNTVVYLKTDMTSSFGILITYQDNDGD